MKMLVLFVALCGAVLAAPQSGPDAQAQITKYDSDNAGIDGYNFNFETSNGISQEEQGTLQNAGSENEVMQVRGSYSFTGADGVVYTVTYVADENGFQPKGAHLPSK
ncbi:endocuticle structural glycoprotein SgAbd-5-like isoform X2 [Euwallacea fornicatus]|uniref:endocuticle structural glycoprotein SgAbd-5-like isoform X2 n=1 Tax=Euwallacea fornicatus TaxID=995702 RepID=UPI0033900B95